MVRIQLEDRGYLEVKEGTYFPLNFALGDIRDISKRSGIFSKTITLTGSDNNNKLLNHYYDINIVSGEFDINQLTTCSVVQDGIVILENAYIQLVEVVKSQDTGAHEQNVEYKVLVKDSVSDFFTAIGNKELTDINLEKYNHTYNALNVANSFSNDITDGYKYIMPYNNDDTFPVTAFHPAIYAKEYFDKIFTQNGYTYEWDNLSPTSGTTDDDNYFQKLIIPYNGGEPKVDKDDSRVEASNTSITTTFNASNSGLSGIGGLLLGHYEDTVTGWTEQTDNDNLFDPTTGVYTSPVSISAPENITFNFEIEYSVRIVNNEAGNVTLAEDRTCNPLVNITDGTPSGSNVLLGSSLQALEIPSGTYSTGATTVQSATTSNVSLALTNIASTTDLNLNTGFFFHQNNIFDLGYFSYNNGTADVDIELVITSITVSAEISANYGFGDTININDYIPKKIKQSDYIKSIFQMYNLFAEPDKTNPSKLILKTRDYFYDGGAEVDWTNKLAKDKDQNLKFLPELASKKMLLTYKQDADEVNKIYERATNDIYGQVRYTFKNEYTRGEDKKELIFSPTPHTRNSFGAYVPMLSFTPNTNIRILIDNGTQTVSPYNIWNYNNGVTQYGQQGLTTAPQCLHFDDPINPTFDINFATCDFYFYDELNSRTNNTLYNNYWRRTLGQIDKGKMLTALFALEESDIQKLKLNDKIRINNSWWNINKVIDYNANSRGLTKVELISVDDEVKLTKFAINSEVSDIVNFINIRPVKPIHPTKPSVATAVKDILNTNAVIENTSLPWQKIDFYGRNNTVDGDVKNAIVIGDGQRIDKDGLYSPNGVFTTSVLLPDGTIWTPSGIIGSPYNLVDAEEDIVLDPFSIAVANFVDAGTDEVLGIGSISTNNMVDANEDTV